MPASTSLSKSRSATRTSEVDELARSAVEKGLIVMAGHTFIYNAAVRYVKEADRWRGTWRNPLHLQPAP